MTTTYTNRVFELDINNADANQIQTICDQQNPNGFNLVYMLTTPTKLFLHFTKVEIVVP